MKKILKQIIVIAGALFTLTATAQIQYSNEFWISTNATGNMYPTNGTLDNPLDGSTQENFDTNMYALPPDSVIHLLPGLYHTHQIVGDGWVKTGDKIIGSGMDVTIVQLDNTADDGTAVFNNDNYGECTNVEISDLTADANSDPPSIGHHGVQIMGTDNAVRRVKSINNYAPASEEVGGIGLNNYHLPDSEGNIIEECEVSSYLGGTVDGLSFGGGTLTNLIGGVIRNNRVYFPYSEDISLYPINFAYVHNALVEGNYISGGQVSIHCDTGGVNNTIIAHNFFVNCLNAVAPYTVGVPENNITIAFNNIDLLWTNNYPSVVLNCWGGIDTNITIFGNTIQTSGSGSGEAYIMTANDITGLEFANNSVDSLLVSNQVNHETASFTNYVNLNMDNNYDLEGNYLYDLNIPTLGGVAVSPFGLSLVNSAEASSALTNLGLPANPMTVITNNQTGVTLGGTFSGNGSGLTNLAATNLVGTISTARLPYFVRAGSVNFINSTTVSVNFSTPVASTNYAVTIALNRGGTPGPFPVVSEGLSTGLTNGFSVYFGTTPISGTLYYTAIQNQ